MIKTKKETLKKNIEVDILIIGAGITGMTTAYFLKDLKNILIVDANRIGFGVTLNTTAKINYFQDNMYNKIIESSDEKVATKYLKSQLYAIKSIKKIIEEENIDCDFKKVKSYVFAKNKNDVRSLIKEVEFLRKNKIKIYEKDLPINIKSYKSFYVNDTYIFNPIKYLEGIYNIIKDKIPVYENTKIIKIESLWTHFNCYTINHIIKAKKVIIATHYPYFLSPLYLPFKSYIEKSYIVVSKVNKDLDFTCISNGRNSYSLRFYNDKQNIYQISLAENHNTAFKQNDDYHFDKVKNIFNIKDSDIVMKYTNVDIMTMDNLPFIGKLKNNMYIASGFNTWGMTNGILSARIISNMILNKPNIYKDIFNPNRFKLTDLKKLPYILYKNKPWYNSNLSFFYKKGKSLACYKDKNDVKHIIYNKCPHLGCSLIFNEAEKTWDCPCHSSRFNIDGKCIKGPSNYDISYKER